MTKNPEKFTDQLWGVMHKHMCVDRCNGAIEFIVEQANVVCYTCLACGKEMFAYK